MKDLRTTNILLLIIVVPLVFYLLKILNFIFIPLILSMFIALLFLPLMRWFHKKRVPRVVSILIVVLIIVGILRLGGELIQLSSNEILSADNAFFEKFRRKLALLLTTVEAFFGIQHVEGEKLLLRYLPDFNVIQNFGNTLTFIRQTASMTLMTVFFTILLLSESINFQKIMNQTLFASRFSSVKTFVKIERDINTFVLVKIVISALTGIGISLACIFFNISFPVFWGLLAFVLNFIQMVGSVLVVLLLSLFAMVEADPSGKVLLFILVITAVQILFGSVIEPIFMGRTFSVNIVTVLIMLMLWGYIWGIPGLIMSVPITVFIKIILEQFPKTRVIASLMSGKEVGVKLGRKARSSKLEANKLEARSE